MEIIKGIILGIILAMPIGPMGILGIQKIIVYGKEHGRIAGYGIAFADFFYAVLAIFGFMSLVSKFPKSWIFPASIIGVVIIYLFAIKIFFTKISDDKIEIDDETPIESFWKMFTLTLTNPVTLVTFIAMMKIFDIQNILWRQLIFAIGVLIGSVFWWYTMGEILDRVKNKFKLHQITIVNRFLGVVLFIFATYELLKDIKII